MNLHVLTPDLTPPTCPLPTQKPKQNDKKNPGSGARTPRSRATWWEYVAQTDAPVPGLTATLPPIFLTPSREPVVSLPGKASNDCSTRHDLFS